ncbi:MULTISPECIES: citrate/2-methylcitrate synthase [Streptomyces]|uniref:citrate synthase (unknown stereospecificity) n=2 Tax=Streptomyces malaysiensis TaxID=92644 RepID=A0ABX6WIQ4_STRMQ|nr:MULTISPECIES: citrate/2-methylcitrate synthase [Streptomyces]AUA08129.1 Citrate synthase 2 [Streptomyces sp. M56]MCM3809326.1 helix-turn-helix domain-containing protein [Streptomyces sp. DR7-3]MCQ6244496.1 helix-turn-helix domain-containing protein [Streptomyces malaysiensis]MYX56982.1 helix-turn-helix domain-containing protein [Streptomyces sp. SID8382]QPI61307.1 helix-turn-helix domain-containing protein [Streptomyces solisilvae]
MSQAAQRRDDVMSVSQAAKVLGVKPSTIYAYISRGLLSSTRLPEDRRSWLSQAEVEAFAHRPGARPVAGSATLEDRAQPTTTVTEPVTSSDVGRIVGHRLVYRGRDVTDLLESGSYGEVAELLWTGELGPSRLRLPEQPTQDLLGRLQDTMPTDSLPLDRLKAAAVLLGASDPFRYDLSRQAVISIARTLAPAFVEALPARAPAADSRHTGDGLAAQLWSKLSGTQPSPKQLALLSGTLILLAEHGLGPSTRAAREAAANEADPYSVVLAGTSVASGLLLGGGSSLAVQAWLEEIDTVTEVPRVLADRLVRGDRVSGFGQPRYPGADPRAAAMMTLLADSGGDEDRQHIVREVVDLVRSRRDLAPNAEFALGAMCFVHRMPRGAGEAVFVIARSAGWIAHAIEEYETAPGMKTPLTHG